MQKAAAVVFIKSKFVCLSRLGGGRNFLLYVDAPKIDVFVSRRPPRRAAFARFNVFILFVVFFSFLQVALPSPGCFMGFCSDGAGSRFSWKHLVPPPLRSFETFWSPVSSPDRANHFPVNSNFGGEKSLTRTFQLCELHHFWWGRTVSAPHALCRPPTCTHTESESNDFTFFQTTSSYSSKLVRKVEAKFWQLTCSHGLQKMQIAAAGRLVLLVASSLSAAKNAFWSKFNRSPRQSRRIDNSHSTW